MQNVKINNPEGLPDEIIQKAIAMMEQEEGRKVVEISIRTTGNPDEYGITPVFEKIPFQRVRRITGYLVGDLSRFNNGKLAEVHDRVKHSV
ncbi:MAG: anaerobic ribonucleoside-triphosphate reductase [Evtepia sp.]|uniref:anaerobic ribonucleoside-triphosphate reductase n=1 Tax=Evtepia sp. TaxID=2773933 RepID=UPI002A755A1E|nr:anaerobic ribonucleoside-triphosphate reductase [Evtepia sp.]MDY3013880.1 anaerobic ribonucleoside-triphosphate reductase [Evtepia sp.]